jgi:isocitrate/isopropylmalate dehydrogenase
MVNEYGIALLPGDGVGPELIDSARIILQAAENKSKNFHMNFRTYPFGKKAYDECGEACPGSTLAGLKSSSAALLGAVSVADIPSPSPIGFLRKELNLFADVRPIRSFPGVWSLKPNIDIVCIRENTEGFLADRNLYKGYGEFMVSKDQVLSLRVITRHACENIARFAFEYARRNKRKSVTVLHKANVLKYGCGLFLQTAQEISKEFPDIQMLDEYIDSAANNLIASPEKYDVLLTTNLFGDIISDEAAALVSSVVPTGNIGPASALFLPINHSPRYKEASKGTVNPIGAILCTAMLLEYLGEIDASESVKSAVTDYLAKGEYANHSTSEVTCGICDRI